MRGRVAQRSDAARRRPASRHRAAAPGRRPSAPSSRIGLAPPARPHSFPTGEQLMPAPGLTREIERYVARTPKSRALQAEAESVLPGGSSRGTAYFSPYPFFADHGDGHYVY